MAKITMKSTKDVMIAEIERLTAELAAVKAGAITVVETQENKRVAEVKKSAEKIVEMNILAPSIIESYNNVQEAIKLAKAELEEITGIKDAIINLEAVLLAGESLTAKQKAEHEAEIAKFKEESAQVIAEKEAKVAQLEQEHKDKKAELEKERKRETEEYNYNLKRTRQKEDDAWEDIKADRERKIAERELAVTTRELAMTEKETVVAELEQRVAGIADEIKEAKDAAFAEAKKAFDKEKAIETNAIKKNSEWEIKVANMEKDRAKEDLEAANAKIAILENKLEAAYTAMNSLATTTVQSSGSVKILDTSKDK